MVKKTPTVRTRRTKKSVHPQLPPVRAIPRIRKPRARPAKKQPESINLCHTSDAVLQAHLQAAFDVNPNAGSSKSVYPLSNNTIRPNKKKKKTSEPSRYGSTQGLPGPAAAFDAPIVRAAPRGVYDYRQLMVNTANNTVPDEFGVTNKNRFPSQEIVPTNGGKHSGRTGPMR